MKQPSSLKLSGLLIRGDAGELVLVWGESRIAFHPEDLVSINEASEQDCDFGELAIPVEIELKPHARLISLEALALRDVFFRQRRPFSIATRLPFRRQSHSAPEFEKKERHFKAGRSLA